MNLSKHNTILIVENIQSLFFTYLLYYTFYLPKMKFILPKVSMIGIQTYDFS